MSRIRHITELKNQKNGLKRDIEEADMQLITVAEKEKSLPGAIEALRAENVVLNRKVTDIKEAIEHQEAILAQSTAVCGENYKILLDAFRDAMASVGFEAQTIAKLDEVSEVVDNLLNICAGEDDQTDTPEDPTMIEVPHAASMDIDNIDDDCDQSIAAVLNELSMHLDLVLDNIEKSPENPLATSLTDATPLRGTPFLCPTPTRLSDRFDATITSPAVRTSSIPEVPPSPAVQKSKSKKSSKTKSSVSSPSRLLVMPSSVPRPTVSSCNPKAGSSHTLELNESSAAPNVSSPKRKSLVLAQRLTVYSPSPGSSFNVENADIVSSTLVSPSMFPGASTTDHSIVSQNDMVRAAAGRPPRRAAAPTNLKIPSLTRQAELLQESIDERLRRSRLKTWK